WRTGAERTEERIVEPEDDGAEPGTTEQSPRGFDAGQLDGGTLADKLLFDAAWMERVLSALHRRGQVILYGPPGTGKTFVAKAIADAVTSQGGSVRRIQFHPSYTYEDFFA